MAARTMTTRLYSSRNHVGIVPVEVTRGAPIIVLSIDNGACTFSIHLSLAEARELAAHLQGGVEDALRPVQMTAADLGAA
jgi:hypothetical protein